MSQPIEDMEGLQDLAASFGGGGLYRNVASVADSEDESYFSDFDSDTETLNPRLFDFLWEHDRSYHRYHKGEYPLPNDETEQDRLDFLHAVYKMTIQCYTPSSQKQTLYLAPLPEGLHRVLDLGTGTGIWAMDMADEFPSAVVIGNDLSPIQPSWVPPNCKFEVDDFEREWAYQPGEYFDYIHGRSLMGSVRSFPDLFRQAFQCLKPNGWFEMQEEERWIRSDYESLQKATCIQNWQRKLDQASQKFGKPFRQAPQLKEMMSDAGFVDVQVEIRKVPIGYWNEDKRLQDLGQYYLVALIESVEPYTLALFTRELGYTSHCARTEIEQVRREIVEMETSAGAMRVVAIPLTSGFMRPYGKPTTGIPQEDIFGTGWGSFRIMVDVIWPIHRVKPSTNT